MCGTHCTYLRCAILEKYKTLQRISFTCTWISVALYCTICGHSVNSVVLQGRTGLPNRKLRRDVLVTQNSMQCMYNMQIQNWAMSKHIGLHTISVQNMFCSQCALYSISTKKPYIQSAPYNLCDITSSQFSAPIAEYLQLHLSARVLLTAYLMYT